MHDWQGFLENLSALGAALKSMGAPQMNSDVRAMLSNQQGNPTYGVGVQRGPVNLPSAVPLGIDDPAIQRRLTAEQLLRDNAPPPARGGRYDDTAFGSTFDLAVPMPGARVGTPAPMPRGQYQPPSPAPRAPVEPGWSRVPIGPRVTEAAARTASPGGADDATVARVFEMLHRGHINKGMR